MPGPQTLSNAQIQNWMQSMLVHHLPIQADALSVEDVVGYSSRMSAQRHLGIYRQSYIARLRDCMKSQFKALAYALGDELFQAFADEYLDSNRSHSYTLNNLGKDFSAYLQNNRPDANNEEKEDWPDFMVELAHFEYMLADIFDMRAATPPETQNHRDDTEIAVSPCLHLFEHQFPICRYYLEYNAGKSPDLPFPTTEYCAVSRQDFRLGLFPIGADQYYFLRCMLSGADFSTAKTSLLNHLQTNTDSFDTVWPTWRANFIHSGLLVLV